MIVQAQLSRCANCSSVFPTITSFYENNCFVDIILQTSAKFCVPHLSAHLYGELTYTIRIGCMILTKPMQLHYAEMYIQEHFISIVSCMLNIEVIAEHSKVRTGRVHKISFSTVQMNRDNSKRI